MPAIRPALAAVALMFLSLVTGCGSSPTSSTSTLNSTGLGKSGVITAEPDSGTEMFEVSSSSACELVDLSPTLTSLGAAGTPVDTSFVVAASMCEVTIDSPEGIITSVGVSMLTASDIALTAHHDSSVSGGSLILLPELGEYGHFLSRVAGVDPYADPASGAILAARGDWGVSIAWSMSESVVPFETFELAVREMLDELPR